MPRCVIVLSETDSPLFGFLAIKPVNYVVQFDSGGINRLFRGNVSWKEQGISWFTDTGDDGYYQLNREGRVVDYVAIG